jgi:hypothetical protein
VREGAGFCIRALSSATETSAELAPSAHAGTTFRVDEADQPPPWKWTESPEFTEDCRTFASDPGEVDYVRGLIADTPLEDPFAASNPLLDEIDTGIRYFRTLDAPGLSHLPPKIVIFRIEDEPEDEDAPRELTGLALWDDDEADA